MTKRKICIVITTRGNYAKMKSVVRAIREMAGLELQVIMAGGAVLDKYGNIARVAHSNGAMKADRVIHFLVEGENPVTMAKSAGLAVTEFSTAFEDLKPDVVIVIADRFECLPIAMAASYMNIPLAHVEGGEVSGSIDESVRHAITKLSHIHFPATADAAERIRRLGEDPAAIYTVGATSLDVLGELAIGDLEPVMELQRTDGVGPYLDLTEPYLVVIQHPVTTEYSENLRNVTETIEALDKIRMNTVWIAPNMDAGSDGIGEGIARFRESRQPRYVHFFKGLPIELFGPLLARSACIVGNSSSGIRESAFLGTPCVNVGSRQTGRERGRNIIDVDYDSDGIFAAVQRQLAHGRYPPDHLYGDGRAGEKIARILAEHRFTLQKRIAY